MANTDLRVQKTKKILKENITQMLLEMDYDKIQIKELCDRSMINRRTFYTHYNSLDDLLHEVLDDIADNFLEYTSGYDHFSNPDRMIKDWFYFTNSNPLFEKINNNIDFNHIREILNKKVISKGTTEFKSISNYDIYTVKLIATYLNSSAVNMYREWCISGKKMPIDKVIGIATTLIKNGILSMTKGSN